MPVEPSPGALGHRIVESQGTPGCVKPALVNGVQGWAGQMLGRPGIEILYLRVDSLDLEGRLNRPDGLLQRREPRVEARGPVPDL